MKPRIRVIVQCRLSSTRLPAKVLLPLAGLPVAALCARRAANTGLDVVVATSTDASDDALQVCLCEHGVKTVRGPIEDVRARFLDASADLDDRDVVVRLTGDNVFPDGRFVEELVGALLKRGTDYICTLSPWDGLPYGLSAEAFRAGALRRVASRADDDFEREHVTPALRAAGDGTPFRPAAAVSDMSCLRCTLDGFTDYTILLRVFEGLRDPVGIGWSALCDRLAALPGAARFRIPFRMKRGRILGALTMGTAQLGLRKYGAANATGQPSPEEATAMIRTAVRHGVTDVDCARAYGDAETVLGDGMQGLPREQVTVVTKLDPLSDLAPEASEAWVIAAVERSVLRSCRELRTRKLDVLMLHRWAHRAANRGAVWVALLRLRDEGVMGALGASVSTPREAAEALQDPDIVCLQLPFNVLDRRWRDAGIPAAVAARPDVTVYARSVFLQGILAAGVEAWPRIEGVNAAEWMARIDRLVCVLNRRSRADLCMAYVRGQSWIDSLVIGMETAGQVEANLDLVRGTPLTPDECLRMESELGGAPERLLNPALW